MAHKSMSAALDALYKAYEKEAREKINGIFQGLYSQELRKQTFEKGIQDFDDGQHYGRFPASMKKKGLTLLLNKSIAHVQKQYAKKLTITHKITFGSQKQKSKHKGRAPLELITFRMNLSIKWKTVRKGGKKYVTRQGDTLALIARNEYGREFFWSDILEANRGHVFQADEQFLMCAELQLPPIDVPVILDEILGPKPKRQANLPVIETYPEVSLSDGFTYDSPHGALYYMGPGFIITGQLSVTGTVTMKKAGRIPYGFSYSSYKQEALAAVKSANWGVKFTDWTQTAVTLTQNLGTGQVKLQLKAMNSAGEFKFSATGVKYEAGVKQMTLSGTLDFALTIKITPVPPVRVKADRGFFDKVWAYKWDIATCLIPGGALLKGAKVAFKYGPKAVKVIKEAPKLAPAFGL